MAEQTFIACPLCGEPIVMSQMQLDIYRGRALTCARCARQFQVDPKRTPLYSLAETGGARLVNPPKPLESASGVAPADPNSNPNQAQTSSAAPGASVSSAPSPGVAPARRPANSGNWKMVVAIVGGFFVIAAIAITLVTMALRRADEETSRVRCAANMVQVSAAIQAYARTNAGQFPDSLDQLFLAQTLTPGALICASTADTPAVGGTPQAWILELQQAGHNSYVYVGRNMTLASAAQQSPSPVVMYEPMTNHHGDGSTVLYADGGTAFLDRIAATAMINRLTAPAPATQPTQSAQPAGN